MLLDSILQEMDDFILELQEEDKTFICKKELINKLNIKINNLEDKINRLEYKVKMLETLLQ